MGAIMMSPKLMPSKTHALLYLALAAAGLALLAASLPILELRPGLPIPGAALAPEGTAAGPGGAAPAGYLLPAWLQAALALAAVALLAALTVALMKRIPWKRTVLLAAGWLLLFVLFSLLPRGSATLYTPLAEPEIAATQPAFVYRVEPIGDPPAGLLRWLALALALSALGAAAWLFARAFRLGAPTDPLADEVEAAAQALATGHDLKDVVIRCYLQMERVMAAEQGIQRPEAMTAREFEAYLAQRGIPAAPVHTLTRLFEQARYGSRPLDGPDEDAARQAILAIRAALRATAPAKIGQLAR